MRCDCGLFLNSGKGVPTRIDWSGLCRGSFANYRSWMNQEKEYIGHAWVEAPGNDDIIDLYFNTTSADLISENTLETSMLAGNFSGRPPTDDI